MIREIIATAKTIEDAVKSGAEKLGVAIENVQSEVLEQPKKGILGIGAQDAKVKVFYELTPAQIAENFVRTVLADMGVEGFELSLNEKSDDEVEISISGGELGVAIGRHGDVLDALQYLTNLAVNRTTDKMIRINVDIENYRSKREETLRSLARRMAQKAVKTGRNVSLEPMNSYERRIIHSEIQNIEGVTTFSVGNDNDRRIIVSPERKQRPNSSPKPRNNPKSAPGKKVVLPEITLPPVKREPIVKVKSIDELNLGDPDDGIEFNPE